MTATHVKILDREAISNMSYFVVFPRMFVHFHSTHEEVCDSLNDLDFCNQCFATYCNV